MALVRDTLLSGLLAVGEQPTAASAASAWVSAFAAYAQTAQDVSGDPLIAGNLAAFQAQLTSLFTQDTAWLAGHPNQAKGNVSPSDAAQGLAKAFASFWTGATFAVAIPVAPGTPGTAGAGTQIFMQEASSVVTVVSPAALALQLTQAFSTPTGSAYDALGRIADALHTACTSDVTVLFTGIDTTPITPLPVTNTNTVH